MAKTLQEAEAFLAALEKSGHDVDAANAALRAAEFTGDPSKIQNARNEYAAAVTADRDSSVTARDIANAAQAVLDLKGEAHTETGVAPPEVVQLGVDMLAAEYTLAIAKRNGRPADEITAAQTKYDAAVTALAEAKAAHARGQFEGDTGE